MAKPASNPEAAMTLLEHLDELRSRLFRSAIAFVVAFALCWSVSARILQFLVEPIRRHLFEGGEIVFINLTEPFLIYMKASALIAVFVASPVILYQLWAFVAPGLHARERRLVVPFLVFGTAFFLTGGAFGYYVATPTAARWLIGLGNEFQAQITLRSAFQFESWIILGMGAVFELPGRRDRGGVRDPDTDRRRGHPRRFCRADGSALPPRGARLVGLPAAS
jgi:sec-independent protein translocase protein TatC